MSSKIECTAVNELIDLVQKKPMDRDSATELLFGSPAGPPAPCGLLADDLVVPSIAVAAVRNAAAATDRRSDPGARHAATVARAAAPRTELRATRTPPFEVTPARTLAFDPVTGRKPRQAEELETTYIPRAAATDLPSLLKKLAVPAGILLLLGIGVGAAISMTRHDGEGTPLNHLATTASPKLLPSARPIVSVPPTVKPKLVAVRIESSPAGASATLLDRDTGNSMPLGSTPLEASLDPAKSYDVRFELEGRPTTTGHLDLAPNDASPKLSVAFADPRPAPLPAPTNKKHRHHHGAMKQAAAKRLATAPRAAKARTNDEAALASLGPAKDRKAYAPGALVKSLFLCNRLKGKHRDSSSVIGQAAAA
ncbi:hypothetical protein BH11MYX1_BH11MYX1_54990 [soil metagenome]